MNIFYLDKDPELAAIYQYNKHVVKMILESAQMLCTAHRYYGNEDVPYKTAHLNHPSTIWCRQNSKQYMWLYNHMIALVHQKILLILLVLSNRISPIFLFPKALNLSRIQEYLGLYQKIQLNLGLNH